MSSSKKIIFLVLLALFLRLLFLRYDFVLDEEGSPVAGLAYNLHAGKGYVYQVAGHNVSYLKQPLYSLIFSLLMYIPVPYDLSGQILSMLIGAMMVIPVYLLAQKMFNETSALLASLAVAFYPFLIKNSLNIGFDTLHAFFLLAAAYFAYLAFFDDDHRSIILASMMFGFSYLARFEAAVYFSVFLFAVVLKGIYRKDPKIFRYLMAGMLFFVLISLPSFIMNQQNPLLSKFDSQVVRLKYMADDKGYLVDTTYDQLYSLNKERSDLSFFESTFGHTSETTSGGLSYLLRNPFSFARRFSAGILYTFSLIELNLFNMMVIALVLYSILGMLIARRTIPKLLFIFSLLALPEMLYAGFLVESRFFVAPVCVSFVLFSDGFLRLLSSVKTRSYFRIAVVAFILILILQYAVFSMDYRPFAAVEHKALGLWMKDNLDVSHVLSTKAFAGYYASGLDWYPIPSANLDDVITYAKNKDIHYLIRDARYLRSENPDLYSEIEGDDRLALIKAISYPRPISIYEIRLS